MEMLGDIWQRFRFSYCGRQRIGRIVTPALTIGLIILVIRWALQPASIQEHVGRKFAVLDDGQINEYLQSMRDARSDECRQSHYDVEKESVSIILDFHEHQFYDLKLTLESIFKNTNEDLIKDVILLDDGTGTEAVQKHAGEYLNQERFKKVHAYRSEKSEGSSLSRFKASKVSEGSILVFLSSDVAVNKGWLEPLVAAVKSDYHLIAVPHFDSLLSGGRFFRTEDNLINTFSWTLDTSYMESTENGPMLTTPVMTGDAFAVGRTFLDSIGSFDEGMDKGFGENLELSLRAWLCGGSIKVIPCSRVAVRSALKPVRIQSPRNFRRIANLWLEEYARFVFKQGEFSRDADEEERVSLLTRQQYLKKITTCRPFGTYLKEVAKDVVIPSSDTRYFGKLKAKTGYCLTSDTVPKVSTKPHIDLVLCKPHMYSSSMVFEIEHKGRIRNKNKQCVQIEDGDVILAPCVAGKSTQLFELEDNGLITTLNQQGKCLSHVSREEGLNRINYLTLQDCPSTDLEQNREFLWSVIKY